MNPALLAHLRDPGLERPYRYAWLPSRQVVRSSLPGFSWSVCADGVQRSAYLEDFDGMTLPKDLPDLSVSDYSMSCRNRVNAPPLLYYGRR